MNLYAILEYDIELNYLYPSKISLDKQQILSEIENITKEDSKGCSVLYLGEINLNENNVYNTESDFILLEEWRPRFRTYGEWKHKIL